MSLDIYFWIWPGLSNERETLLTVKHVVISVSGGNKIYLSKQKTSILLSLCLKNDNKTIITVQFEGGTSFY